MPSSAARRDALSGSKLSEGAGFLLDQCQTTPRGRTLPPPARNRCALLKLRIDNSMIGAKNREEGVKITYAPISCGQQTQCSSRGRMGIVASNRPARASARDWAVPLSAPMVLGKQSRRRAASRALRLSLPRQGRAASVAARSPAPAILPAPVPLPTSVMLPPPIKLRRFGFWGETVGGRPGRRSCGGDSRCARVPSHSPRSPHVNS
jgi:hypothetical protein